jgi:hypothetical protein
MYSALANAWIAARGKIQKKTPRNKKRLDILSCRALVLADTCAFAQIMSRGSGATDTSRIWGLLVSGEDAAQVTDVKSRNVTKPVEDIVAPTTLSIA